MTSYGPDQTGRHGQRGRDPVVLTYTGPVQRTHFEPQRCRSPFVFYNTLMVQTGWRLVKNGNQGPSVPYLYAAAGVLQSQR
jgi:hypothetical protein